MMSQTSDSLTLANILLQSGTRKIYICPAPPASHLPAKPPTYSTTTFFLGGG